MMNQAIYKWEARHASIFNALVEKLNKSGVKYFILRNYEGLPEVNESKDIDIIIEPGSYKQAASFMYEALKENNVPNYYVVRYERVRCWLGMDVEADFSIHIDLIEGYLNKGFELFKFSELYEQTHLYKNFHVLDDAMDVSMLLLYKVIAAKQLKPSYRKKISSVYPLQKNHVDKILVKVLGEKLASEIICDLDNENYDAICDKAHLISKVSKNKAFFKYPLTTSWNITKFFSEKLYRIGWCPNKFKKFFAVEAPDGTGKTTFIDGLNVKLAEMFVTDIEKMHVYHFRPTILPNLGAVGEKATAGKVKQDTDFTNPHRNPPANPVSSFIRMTYYWLDYLLGGLICLRKDVQFDKFSIFDRYIYDFIVDPKRSRINLPMWLRKLYTKMVYQPHFVFVLLCDAQTIYKRKQELTLEEIDRQLKVFNGLAESGKRFVKLNAAQTPDAIVKDALKILIDRYTNKVK